MLTHIATLAFALSLTLFTIALIIKQIDDIANRPGGDGRYDQRVDDILCAIIALIFAAVFGATFVLLHQNGTLHQLDGS